MDIDRVLAGLPDDDDDPVPMIPRADNLVAMDDAFTATDYAIATAEDNAPTFSKDTTHEMRPMRRQRTVKECRTPAELAELDALMLKFAR